MKIIENLNVVTEKLNEYKHIKNEIRNKIKTNLELINRYISVGSGIVSPNIAEKSINDVLSISKIWIKDKEILKELEEIMNEIKENCFYYEENERKEKNSSIVNNKKEYIPNYIERLRPNSIVRGDVSFLPIGPIQHYCIVLKVVENTAYVIPITTDGDKFVGYDVSKSRFFKGKAIYSIVQVPVQLALTKFVMPYDSKTELKEIISGIESFMKCSILTRTYKKRKK